MIADSLVVIGTNFAIHFLFIGSFYNIENVKATEEAELFFVRVKG